MPYAAAIAQQALHRRPAIREPEWRPWARVRCGWNGGGHQYRTLAFSRSANDIGGRNGGQTVCRDRVQWLGGSWTVPPRYLLWSTDVPQPSRAGNNHGHRDFMRVASTAI